MLRPACLPGPPGWLRRDAITCSAPRLLRLRVTPAFDGARHQAPLGVRLKGRTGNLPSSGLSPDQFTAGSEAAPYESLEPESLRNIHYQTLAQASTLPLFGP